MTAAVDDLRITRPALRYHGAKFRLAKWLLPFFPPHRCYVEPFGGAAGVLLQKERAYAEVYNDLDGDVVNFFRVLRDPDTRAALIAAIVLTPYARDEFELAWQMVDEPIERARRLAVRAQMGFGSAGASKGSTGFRVDTNRAYGTAQQHWANYPEAIAAVGQRLTGVLIENRPALDTLRAHDAATTLHFVDPPYLHSTRSSRSSEMRRYFKHEMTDADHVALIEAAQGLAGMVILCGYPNALYTQQMPPDWSCYLTTSRIAAGRGCAVRTEAIWINPACRAALVTAGAKFPEVA
jgi:DNA adenine methylase